MKKVVIVCLCCVSPVALFAQHKIETDRPTESQSAELVQKGAFQAEVGFRFEHKKENNYVYQQPNAVFRYGLFNRFELRLGVDLETQKFSSQTPSVHTLKPIELGLKLNLFQAYDSSFTTSFYGQIGIPSLASKNNQYEEVFYRVRLLLQNKLAEKWTLTYNLGTDWNDEEREQNWLYALSPQFELSEKWLTFLEAYGTFQKGSSPEHYIDGGIAFNMCRNIRLDIAVGKGLNSRSSDYFLTTGISFKL